MTILHKFSVLGLLCVATLCEDGLIGKVRAQYQLSEVAIGAYILPGSPSDILFKNYAATIDDASGGALEAKLMIYGEAGSEERQLSALRRGRMQVASISSLVLSNLMPEIEITMAPFLFDTLEEFDFVLDTYLLDEFQALVAERDLTVLRWIELGGQNFYGKKPILWPEDVRGYRMRASSDTATKVIWELLDADLIFLPSSELVPALQTGLLDGGAAVPLVYSGIGISEHASHYTLSSHFYIGALLMANQRWLDSLPDSLRRIVIDSFATNEEIRSTFRILSRDFVVNAASAGVTVHSLTRDQRAAWKAAATGSHRRLIEVIGGRSQQIYDVIQEGKRVYAAQQN